jgi:ParB-like chromosome segregation protein Spo0J
MLKAKAVGTANVYVPTKLRTTLEPSKVAEIAQSILEKGQTTPILVREDGEPFVLVEGLHRLEACKSLGEETILAYLVQARRH